MELGFIGLGAMGLPMCRNLRQAGYAVTGFDLDQERMEQAAVVGIDTAAAIGPMVERSDLVLTSLPSSDAFVGLAEKELMPRLRVGQGILDMGTTAPPQARRLAAAAAAKGGFLVDAPVSGGPDGADKGDLYIFVGGDEAAVKSCWPLLEALGGEGRVTHGGPSGAGQVLKGVNQLMMGLVNAAYLETVALGVRGGVSPEMIAQAIGTEGARDQVQRLARRVAAGQGDQIGVKFRELPYFLHEAQASGFRLPLTETLYGFCQAGERVVVDDNRPAPSYWHQLMQD
jgi:2-hydroxy-3-oxopropionate reductase